LSDSPCGLETAPQPTTWTAGLLTRSFIGYIHLWGSRVWVCGLTAGKLDPRGRGGRFAGYDAKSEGCHVYWTDSRTIGVERDLIFEDRPMDNELIFLPGSSVAKRSSEAIRHVPTTSQAPSTNANISPSNIPLPPPDENATANSEPLTPPAKTTPESDAGQVDTPSVNHHIRRSTRVWKPSAYIRKVLTGKIDGGTARSKSKLQKGLQAPVGSAAIAEECESRPQHTPFTPEI